MASYTKLPSGAWRAQIRRKGQYVSKSFQRKVDAGDWATEREQAFNSGQSLKSPLVTSKSTFSDLIKLYRVDMRAVGKPILRTKAAVLEKLERLIGSETLSFLTRERLIEYGKARAREGAGPVTLSMDLTYIRTTLVHAAAVHGIDVETEPVMLARVALSRLGLIGKSVERDRRPTQDELDRIITYCDANPCQVIPLGRIVKFAVASAMRQEEICTFLRKHGP